MPKSLTISFAKPDLPNKGTVVIFIAKDGALSPSAEALDKDGLITRAIGVAEFTGKARTTLNLIAPAGHPFDRILLIGLGDIAEMSDEDWTRLGGVAVAAVAKAGAATIMADIAGSDPTLDGEKVAAIAMGAKLRAYRFDAYKTTGKDEAKSLKLVIASAAAASARKTWKGLEGIAEGVMLARDLVNEPANILGPSEFAERCRQLEELGVKVEILDEKRMKRMKMDALLGVGIGSERPPRLAVMQWKGGKANSKPVAFVGKGVVFDTGGISIKPAAGMEDMKGDMGGAAAVTGLMHALASRKAKANVIGIVGLVENMPDGRAQRPGDIVKSMSKQTIEVINTDAEGRLVLGDALWYCQDRFKPQLMIDLATLTGAVLVALGNEHAGLFSNNDELAARISAAGEATGEKVWRLPLGKAYDKLIDSKNADMKNIGGRNAGSITAAQFLKRFVNDVPWAHLDIAGTAMSSPKTEINQSWASGYGVRLLERLVRDYYEG